MFNKTEFNKYVERCAETQESFFTAIENKDYVAARAFLDKQFNLIHTMRKLGRNAYEELDFRSFAYANAYADFFEGRLPLDVLDLIDELTGNINK